MGEATSITGDPTSEGVGLFGDACVDPGVLRRTLRLVIGVVREILPESCEFAEAAGVSAGTKS